jgi:hypothetical protein
LTFARALQLLLLVLVLLVLLLLLLRDFLKNTHYAIVESWGLAQLGSLPYLNTHFKMIVHG